MLQERRADIEILALHYIGLFCKRYDMVMKGVSAEFMDTLKTYTWPGNVRELVNVMDLSIANSYMHDVLLPIHLPVDVRVSTKRHSMEKNDTSMPMVHYETSWAKGDLPTLSESLVETEKRYIQSLIKHTEGDIQAACRISGLSRSSLYTRLKKYNIERPT